MKTLDGTVYIGDRGLCRSSTGIEGFSGDLGTLSDERRTRRVESLDESDQLPTLCT